MFFVANSIYTVSFTGHRPSSRPQDSKLFGLTYSNFLTHPKSLVFIEWMACHLLEIAKSHNNALHVIQGMALGVDQMVAEAAFLARERGLALGIKITVEAAVPCANHPCKWPIRSQVRYQSILLKCDKVTMVSSLPYTNSCMQKRNEYMVDNCDLLIAIWDGSAGGTSNCVRYARSIGAQIEVIEPFRFA